MTKDINGVNLEGAENPTSALTSSRSGRTLNDIPPLPPPTDDESDSPFVQSGVSRKNLQPASVTYLDGGAHAFYVHKNSTGDTLFELVCAQMNLQEKDYFGLFFYDEQNTRHSLYRDRRINKQLKALPWRFFFEVKFYPPQPSQLAEDLTRYLLCLQLRQDVFDDKLPTSFVTQSKLGALTAQAEYGDFESTEAYGQYLRNAKIAQVVTEPLTEKVVELHKQHRGLTAPEAELAYLNECKDLAMYGVILFPGKDSKGKAVQIGISAHGISVYNDQMRVHRFAWANIIKFSYRRNVFSIKLKPGELEKKDTNVSYKLTDYPAAKRLWKCAVEHHTFFRLIQPEARAKTSILRLGSSRFRYQGRTNFQSQMASQLFDGAGGGAATASVGRIASKSSENIVVKGAKEHTSPLHYADAGSRDLIHTPEKKKTGVYETHQRTKERNGDEIGKKKSKKEKKEKENNSKTKKKSKKDGVDVSSSSSSSSDSSLSEDEIAEKKANEARASIMSDNSKRQRSIVNSTSATNSMLTESAGPYTPAIDPLDGRVIREEKVEQLYKIVGGAGERVPQVDPANAEASLPHSTVHTWHETSAGPETVTTEVDEHGNVTKRTVIKSEQVKHTVHTQSYQTFAVDENTAPTEQTAIQPRKDVTKPIPPETAPRPAPPKRTGDKGIDPSSTTTVAHTIAYENGAPIDVTNTGHWSMPGNGTAATNGNVEFTEKDLVSTKAVTTGNRTVETLTYKKEKDGAIETHVEHRITIHGGDDVDHDAELSRAILEATNMNPEMTVEKVEVRHDRTVGSN